MEPLEDREIIAKLQRLDPQQVAEGVDFIEALTYRESKDKPLVQFLRETAVADIDLEDDAVRQQ